LQVGVNLHHCIAASVQIISQDRTLETDVFGKLDGTHARVARGQVCQHGPGSVVGMVVRKNEFKVAFVAHAFAKCVQTRIQRSNILGFIQYRDRY
jgi:hypothetical protein